MEVFFFIILPISSIISFVWVMGIDNMHENHSDYKGEDFLNY